MAAGVRNPAQIAGLAVPTILGLAAIGLDQLLHKKWPSIHLEFNDDPKGSSYLPLDLRWLLAIPLVLALKDAQNYGKNWVLVAPHNPSIAKLNMALRTPDLQWVNPPFGEHFYIESAVAMGLKMYTGIQTWFWKDHQYPEPVLEANYMGPPPGMSEYQIVEGIPIYKAPPGREYAVVRFDSGEPATVCTARGTGGDIDVTCDIPVDGVLTIKENRWAGWRATIAGRNAPLLKGQWLAVELPAGRHTIWFRYRPWDAPLGIILSILGLALAVYAWKYDDLVRAETELRQ
jgi:hypothetical protein